MAVVVMIRRNLGSIKEKVLGKLASASVPADALENSRHFIESVIRDVTVAAHGLTRDALLRIKTHLADLLPSLSPNITRKIVDDAEKETSIGTSDGEKEEEIHHRQNKQGGGVSVGAPFRSPTSSPFSSLIKPLSRL
ncbi:F17F16.6 protein [Citrus sinensis]|uniref:Uncharacterized protein n=1 Tax=Citrus unshiu TaxID=55188 RepID=A0A2H5Q0L6_CITUN|nr:uncharacterized protein LOC102623681 isoform X1 [Citrus sinensis]KAH9662182.1 F17F16.6 protein [Citrus sinensis]GAY58180.1 hypothetical protein CUMW_185140 [Citrus unshiu]